MAAAGSGAAGIRRPPGHVGSRTTRFDGEQMPNDFEVLIPIMGILLVMIPVTGVTVGILIRTLAKVRRESDGADRQVHFAAQVAQLQEEVESLSAEVRELKAAQEFDRKLLAERAGGATRAPGT